MALVLAPEPSARTIAAFDWSLASGASVAVAPASPAARALAGNAMADALPLFEQLACGSTGELRLPLSSTLSLRLVPKPLALRGSERRA